MTTPEKKLHFDSVDPTFNDRVPTEREITDKNYFAVLGPLFEQNARFSKKQPVPTLGDINTPQHQNEKFYNFWYTFESWRVFNYLDEDEVTGDKYVVVVLLCSLDLSSSIQSRTTFLLLRSIQPW